MIRSKSTRVQASLSPFISVGFFGEEKVYIFWSRLTCLHVHGHRLPDPHPGGSSTPVSLDFRHCSLVDEDLNGPTLYSENSNLRRKGPGQAFT